VLSDEDKRRFARQILLPEIGLAGQERLAAAEASWPCELDPRSRAIAADYLARAGMRLSASGAEAASRSALQVPLVTRADVERVAGDRELEDCAAWLLGALCAVETIKSALGVGVAGSPAALAAREPVESR
jgi:hypothetical protein